MGGHPQSRARRPGGRWRSPSLPRVPELEAYLATGKSTKRVIRQFDLTESEAAQLDSTPCSWRMGDGVPRSLVNREVALMSVVRTEKQNLNGGIRDSAGEKSRFRHQNVQKGGELPV